MRQLVFIRPGQLEWHDVPAPRIAAATDAVVRPIAVAHCDLDLYLATGLVPARGRFAFGHECVGEIVETGDGINIDPGTRVAVPFQLSCGRCGACRRGWTNSCAAYPFGAAYELPTSGREFGGALSDLILVPFADHMLVRLPEGIAPEAAASAPDNVADGWRAVGPHLASRPGASVLVVGGLAQSIGLYAADCASMLGATRVLYLDDSAAQRARATSLGVDVAPLALAEGRAPGEQFEIVVEAAGNAAVLAFAMESTAANGVLTSMSIHFDAVTPVPLTRAYYKGLTFHTGRVQSRACLPEVLSRLACGSLHTERVIHRIAQFSEAADAMTDPGPKLVFLP